MELFGNQFIDKEEWAQEDLDYKSEALIRDFMLMQHGSYFYPIPTDTLIRLVKQDAVLNLQADLSPIGDDVLGYTYLYHDKRPEVFITKDLWRPQIQEQELRRALAHEYGHVKLHGPLLAMAGLAPLFSFEEYELTTELSCKAVASDPYDDWQEQQAEYFAGGLLMPHSLLDEAVQLLNPRRGYFRRHFHPLSLDKESTKKFIKRIAKCFSVSCEFAQERLMALEYVLESDPAMGPLQVKLFNI